MIYTSPARTVDLRGDGLENNPFIAWDNIGASATLGGTSVYSGGERANAVSGTTFDKWRPIVAANTADLQFDLGSPQIVTFGAISSHNMRDFGANVALQYRNSSSEGWAGTGNGAVTPPDNNPVGLRILGRIAARYWRFLFYGAGLVDGARLAVGVAFLGRELIIPRRIYQGYSPVLTPTEVELQSNVSVGSELLGSSVVLRGATLSAAIPNVPEDFVRGADWLSFQRNFNEGKPFFFAWRPEKHATDLHYCARDGAVMRPSNSGPRSLMQIGMEARVYGNF